MVLSTSFASAQDLDWAKQAGGTDDDQGRGIAVDASGNSYVTGFFRGSATFGAGEADETTLVGFHGIFVAKYDGNGNLVWAKQAERGFGEGIAVDPSGNSYVSGVFRGTATFGVGEEDETTLVSAGSFDIFVAKYDGNGDLVWAEQAGGTDDDRGWGIAVDPSGNSYVTGRFRGSATFGAGEADETTLVSSNGIFVAKYDGGIPDTDSDGTPDNVDLCPSTSANTPVDASGCSDAQVDQDSDGVCDPDAPVTGPSGCTGSDNCPTVANADQTDVNEDGFGNACVSPNANIGNGVELGEGVVIGEDVIIGRDAVIGDGANLGEGAEVNKGASVGSNSIIGSNSVIATLASVGDNVVIGSEVTVNKSAIIGAGVILGTGVIIEKEVIIGDETSIGDRTVVNNSVSIGARSAVGSDVLIGRDAQVGERVTIADGQIIPKNTVIPDDATVP